MTHVRQFYHFVHSSHHIGESNPVVVITDAAAIVRQRVAPTRKAVYAATFVHLSSFTRQNGHGQE